MLIILQKIFDILDKDQKNKIFKIQIANLIVSLFEIITLGSLAIFIGLLASKENIFDNSYLLSFYNYFEFANKFEFMFFLGIIVLSLYNFYFDTLLQKVHLWLQ